MKRLISFLLPVSFTIVFAVNTLQAQGPIDPPCENEDPSTCPDVPFDGGASLIIAGGAGLLGWTAYKRKKKE